MVMAILPTTRPLGMEVRGVMVDGTFRRQPSKDVKQHRFEWPECISRCNALDSCRLLPTVVVSMHLSLPCIVHDDPLTTQ